MICRRKAEQRRIKVLATDWRTEAKIDSDVTYLAASAIEGVKRFAAEHSVDLNEWDVTISKFAYHPVDSGGRVTQIAAFNAIASAMASWQQTCGNGARDRTNR